MARRTRRRRNTYSMSKWFRQRIVGLAFLLFGVLMIGAVNYVLGFVPSQYIYFDNGVLAVSTTPPTTTTTTTAVLERNTTIYDYMGHGSYLQLSNNTINVTVYANVYATVYDTEVHIYTDSTNYRITYDPSTGNVVLYVNTTQVANTTITTYSYIIISMNYTTLVVMNDTLYPYIVYNVTGQFTEFDNIKYYGENEATVTEVYWGTTVAQIPLPAVSNTVIIQLIGWAVGILFVLVALRKLGLSI